MSDFGAAAFRSTPYTVHVDDAEYVFHPVPAARWLDALGAPGWPLTVTSNFTEGMSYTRLYDALSEDRLPEDHVLRTARAALAEAAGRPWWEAERLASMALRPEFLGHLLMRGADPATMTLAAFLALVHATVMQAQDRMGQMKFDAEISMPPPEALDEVPEEDVSVTVERMRAIAGVRVG